MIHKESNTGGVLYHPSMKVYAAGTSCYKTSDRSDCYDLFIARVIRSDLVVVVVVVAVVFRREGRGERRRGGDGI